MKNDRSSDDGVQSDGVERLDLVRVDDPVPIRYGELYGEPQAGAEFCDMRVHKVAEIELIQCRSCKTSEAETCAVQAVRVLADEASFSEGLDDPQSCSAVNSQASCDLKELARLFAAELQNFYRPTNCLSHLDTFIL